MPTTTLQLQKSASISLATHQLSNLLQTAQQLRYKNSMSSHRANGALTILFATIVEELALAMQQGFSKAVSDGSFKDQRGTSAFSLFGTT
jgi:hypothetical protein